MMRDVVASMLPSVVVAMLVLAPANALAGRSHGGGAAHVGAGGSFVGHRAGIPLAPPTVLTATGGNHRGPTVLTATGLQGRPGFHRPIGVSAQRGGAPHAMHHRFVPTSFVPVSTVAVVTTPNVYVPPPVNYETAPYDPGLDYGRGMSYGPAGTVAVAPPPPAPPMPNVVEYSTGRYELRGDGFTNPYTWVWIPNPPPAPPASPPQAPTAGGTSPSRRTQLYRWTDEDGVAHWTDRIDVVPERYRAQAAQPRTP